MDKNAAIPIERIQSMVHLIRGQKVLLDKDLADLYGVETRSLVQAVKRNIERFPSDFMFQLTRDEFDSLRSQSVISKGKGGRRYLPHAFTEQGVAMLSSVLRSKWAIQVNVAIMRAFVELRQVLSSHKDLERKLEELQHKIEDHEESIEAIFEAIRQLISPPEKPRRKIGFGVKEGREGYGTGLTD
ncbi:MAG: ORF6N domain-containing protein [Deltaproteobacteria bacterium]|nr:ORF6N domain-containing protein [Deltaproteobacteria bacterium]